MEKLLKKEQLLELFPVSRSTLDRYIKKWIEDGLVRPIRTGRLVLFKPSEIAQVQQRGGEVDA